MAPVSVRFRGKSGASGDGVGCRAASCAAGEEAAAEESSFQGTVSVNTAATEAGDFASCVEPGERLARRLKHATVEVGFGAAQALAGQNGQSHRDQRPGSGVQDAV